MGNYLNPGNRGFRKSIRSEIFVDKSDLISYTNKVLDTEEQYICVSRPRRFGKSMAAKMLAAYYDCSVNSKELFTGLSIEADPSYFEHLNKYHVLFLNMQDFVTATKSADEMIEYLKEQILDDLEEEFPLEVEKSKRVFINSFNRISSSTGASFIIIIDEWDCIFRMFPEDSNYQQKYLDFLRSWLKGKDYVKLAYMTGILPIKKYGIHSALNMFDEFSMTSPSALSEYFGFKESEVLKLSQKYGMDFSEVRNWYDGYMLGKDLHIFSPKSVVDAMRKQRLDNYWTSTETYEALQIYLDLNYDGLKDDIIRMLSGQSVEIDTLTFQNDMKTFAVKDDVLTLLIHLGYLSYDAEHKIVSIPNEEVRSEFVRAIRFTEGFSPIIKSINASEALLKSALQGDEKAVAKGIEEAHMLNTSLIEYNDENSLSCIISLAFYSARKYYSFHREFPTGKGLADIVLLPRSIHPEKPAIIFELKWNKSAEAAMDQIKKKQYPKALEDYLGEILLVGINYDTKSKEHRCLIEKLRK